ncbi:hypothetical protein ACFHWW_34195, partial [Ensifer sp. P24N7]|uniref:hypothetical protein n=1 Tax=Sinorhizobium sp. P24N7 TaxID=3348358 RepID=UPI0035F454A7
MLDQPDVRFDALRNVLAETGIPGPDVALLRARQEAAFDTAVRLASRFDIDAHDDIRNDMVSFAETWQTEIERRERRLKSLAKVDYNHQDLISRRLKWCEMALARLTAIKDGSEIHDLADVPARTIELDDISSEIEANIRSDQTERIWQY